MLYIVPTPIGNLKDITLRALDVLREADAVVCEDTRHSGLLLKHYEIQKPLLSFHEHSGPGRVEQIVAQMAEGKKIALITDSGTPLISDPGFPLVRAAVRRGIPVVPLPGPTAAFAALSASGLPAVRVTFEGFLPPKGSARRKALEALAPRPDTLLFYESPFRLAASLADMAAVLGAEREAAVCRELTKKFEEIVRGHLGELAGRYAGKRVLGEIVLAVAGFGAKPVFEPGVRS